MEKPSAIAREYTSGRRPKDCLSLIPSSDKDIPIPRSGYYGQELDRTSVEPQPTIESLLITDRKLLTTWGSGFSTKGF
ncbi:hypothetical protein N7519_011779 [Penicillium mononematosum]|uniref:uncharacterized protein n=1 Tax=Penicillium mononematosum TaxID=268346 RepID=UPI0025467563|nr:uncharacterized protein N7519_011779 [Penicillium mononematosum]KAJ6181318.1 hypothetical protein N7519_011779 [Penicillium mononematosum]